MYVAEALNESYRPPQGYIQTFPPTDLLHRPRACLPHSTHSPSQQTYPMAQESPTVSPNPFRLILDRVRDASPTDKAAVATEAGWRDDSVYGDGRRRSRRIHAE